MADNSADNPFVIVIENPNEDPTVIVVGDIEVVELSSYPASKYASDEEEFDGWRDQMTAVRDRVANHPNLDDAGRASAVQTIDCIVSDYDSRLEL